MVENGRNLRKELENMNDPEIKMNINVKLLPFGCIQIEMKGPEGVGENIVRHPVVYGEPGTTGQQIAEIPFNREEYGVHKTTGGIL